MFVKVGSNTVSNSQILTESHRLWGQDTLQYTQFVSTCFDLAILFDSFCSSHQESKLGTLSFFDVEKQYTLQKLT